MSTEASDLRAALEGARDDIRARRREFVRLGADPQYVMALDDAFGLVSNRLRSVLAPLPAPESEPVIPTVKSSGEVVDLLAALQKSVTAARAARGESNHNQAEPKCPHYGGALNECSICTGVDG